MSLLGYNIQQATINPMITELKEKLVQNAQEKRLLEERLALLRDLNYDIMKNELMRLGLSEADIEEAMNTIGD